MIIFTILKNCPLRAFYNIASELETQMSFGVTQFVTDTEYEFLSILLSPGKMASASDSADFHNAFKIFSHIEHGELDLTNYFNYKKTALEDLQYIRRDVLLSIIEQLDFNRLEDTKSVMKFLFENQHSELIEKIVTKYPDLEIDNITVYSQSGYEQENKISLNPILFSLPISNLSSLKTQYLQNSRKIDFSKMGETKYFKKMNSKDLVKEFDRTDYFYKKSNSLFTQLVDSMCEKYEGIAGKGKRRRDEQRSMREMPIEMQGIVDFFDKNNISYDHVNTFNQALIRMVKSYPDIVKTLIVKHKDVVDLSVEDMNRQNLTGMLLANLEFSILQSLLKKKKLSYGQIYYQGTFHPIASLSRTVLSYNDKVTDTRIKQMDEVVKKIAADTDWSYKNEVGNIAAQFLTVNTENYYNVTFTDTINVTSRSSYSTQHLPETLQFFYKKGVSMTEPNSLGYSASELLLDVDILHYSSNYSTMLIEGRDSLGMPAITDPYDVQQIMLRLIDRGHDILKQKESYQQKNAIEKFLKTLKSAGYLSDNSVNEVFGARIAANKALQDIMNTHTTSDLVMESNIIVEKCSLMVNFAAVQPRKTHKI